MYILVTPVKNEESYLPRVAEAVVGQTQPPVLWFIVDDGSSDDTPKIIEDLTNSFDWIQSQRLPEHPRDITFHYSFVCRNGFDKAIGYCRANGIEYDYICLLDADTVVEEEYFEKLFQEFEKDDQLGIASGYIYDLVSETIPWDEIERNRPNGKLPRGSGRVWRKSCFFETEGYLEELSPDSISNVKALLRGWKIAEIGHILAIQQRQTSGADGLWKGYFIDGNSAHYLNKHPVLVLLSSLLYSTNKPYYLGVAYFFGYFLAWIKRAEQIRDQEIRDYYWNDRLREYVCEQKRFR